MRVESLSLIYLNTLSNNQESIALKLIHAAYPGPSF